MLSANLLQLFCTACAVLEVRRNASRTSPSDHISWLPVAEVCCVCSVASSELGDSIGTYVNSEKDAQADLGGLRCELGLYDNEGSDDKIVSNGTCAANPADCGTLGKVRA